MMVGDDLHDNVTPEMLDTLFAKYSVKTGAVN